LLLLPLVAAPSIAWGQAATDEPATTIEKVVVTAPGSAQDGQKDAMAATSADGATLAAAGVYAPRDLVKLAPSLQIEDPGNGANLQLNIRGVGERETDPHEEAPNSLFIDGAYVSFAFAASQPLFDVDHVEVLEGPQGTLFGRDDTGGVLNVVNKRPTRRPEGYVQATFGSYGQAGLEGAIAGPLGPKVSGRLSIYSNENGDYVRNLGSGGDTGKDRSAFVRGQLLFEPTDRFSLLIDGRHWEVGPEPSVGLNFKASVPGPSGEPVAPASLAAFQAFCAAPFAPAPISYGAPTTLQGSCFGANAGPFTTNFAHPTRYRVRLSGVSATASLKLNGALTLTSVTDYFRMTTDFGIDAGAAQVFLINGENQLQGQQFSQELRLVGNHNRFRWAAGLYYLAIDADTRNTYNASGQPVILTETIDNYVTPTRAWAAFGRAEYDLSSSLTIVGGLRYGVDRKSINSTTTCIPALLGPFPGVPYTSTCDPTLPSLVGTVRALPGFTRDLNKGDWAGKLQLNWKPAPDLLLYAGITRGTKAGGFNSAGTYPPQFIVYQPETLIDYEAGAKVSAFRQSTNLKIALFHYDYRNFQTVAADTTGRTYARNVNAENDGAEATLGATPFAGFSLDLGATYLWAVEKHLPVLGRVVDQPMPFAPAFRSTATARYEREMLGGKAAIQADWQHTAHKTTQAVDVPYLRIPTEDVVDAELSWTTQDGHLTFAARADNLTGAPITGDVNDFTLVLGGVGRFYEPPRWFRGTVTYNF
jgi:iron complex outermembrane receptor protein